MFEQQVDIVNRFQSSFLFFFSIFWAGVAGSLRSEQVELGLRIRAASLGLVESCGSEQVESGYRISIGSEQEK